MTFISEISRAIYRITGHLSRSYITLSVLILAGLLNQAAYATNVRLGNTLYTNGSPLKAGAVFYVDFWYQTDSPTIGVVASDILVTHSADLEIVDDPQSLLKSEAIVDADVYLYDVFYKFADVKIDAIGQTLAIRGGVDLSGGSKGVGQNGAKAKFGRVAFRNIQGGGFTIKIEGNIGIYGDIVQWHDWLGVIGKGPTESVIYEIAGGGEGLP